MHQKKLCLPTFSLYLEINSVNLTVSKNLQFFLATKSDCGVTISILLKMQVSEELSPPIWSKFVWNSLNFPFPWHFGNKNSRYLFLLFPFDFVGPKEACQKKFNRRHWWKWNHYNTNKLFISFTIWYHPTQTIQTSLQCVKSVQIRSHFGLHFPVFGPEITSYLDNFDAVFLYDNW